jgi:hypothetical protein
MIQSQTSKKPPDIAKTTKSKDREKLKKDDKDKKEREKTEVTKQKEQNDYEKEQLGKIRDIYMADNHERLIDMANYDEFMPEAIDTFPEMEGLQKKDFGTIVLSLLLIYFLNLIFNLELSNLSTIVYVMCVSYLIIIWSDVRDFAYKCFYEYSLYEICVRLKNVFVKSQEKPVSKKILFKDSSKRWFSWKKVKNKKQLNDKIARIKVTDLILAQKDEKYQERGEILDLTTEEEPPANTKFNFITEINMIPNQTVFAEIDSDSHISMISEKYFQKIREEQKDMRILNEDNTTFKGVGGPIIRAQFPPLALTFNMGGIKFSNRFTVSDTLNSNPNPVLLGNDFMYKYHIGLVPTGEKQWRLIAGSSPTVSSVPIYVTKKTSVQSTGVAAEIRPSSNNET